MKKLFSLLVLGMFALCALTSCGNEKAKWEDDKFDKTVTIDESVLVTPGKLTVAVSPDYPPYEFFDSSKTGRSAFEGSDIYFANYVAQSLGLELELVEIAFDNLFAAIPGKRADIIISGLTYEAERAENYFLTNSYYDDGEGSQVIVINKTDSSVFTSLESLNDTSCKVAAQVNSLQSALVASQLPNCTQQDISLVSDGVTQLKNGNVDALAVSQYVAETLCEQNTDLMIITGTSFECKNSGLVACLDKENTALGTAVNNVIDKMPATMYDDWFKDAKDLAIKLGAME